MVSGEYEGTELSEDIEKKLPQLHEELKTRLNQVREKREEIADSNRIIEEIKNYKSINVEKK